MLSSKTRAKYKGRTIIRSKANRNSKRISRLESGIEYKYVDKLTATIPPVVDGDFELLNGITQDDTATTRNGDSVKNIGLEINLWFNAYVANDHNVIRMLVILDKQPNNAIFTLAQLLEDATAADAVLSPKNLDFKHRFRFICDQRITISNTSKANHYLKKFVKLNFKTRYNATGNSIASITTNSLYLLLIGANTLGDYQGFCRLKYVD